MEIAVIKTGGKQYKVKVGDKIKIEKIDGKTGDLVKLDVLLIANNKGENLEIGRPLLEKKAEVKILKQDRSKKISVIKYKRKTRYKRNIGHRQPYTEIEVIKL